jgi:ribosome biogenesis GTPase
MTEGYLTFLTEPSARPTTRAVEEGRVIRSQSGHVVVQTANGPITCSLRGRLKKDRKAKTDLVRVNVEEGVIESVAPRRNRFARRQPGGRGAYKEDVLVANLDRTFPTFSCSLPPVNPRLVDRFLVIAEHANIEPVIVANKIDETEERPFDRYRAIGYRVIYTSAVRGDGIDELRDELRDRVGAFVGPSGVGKSSLLNAIEPGLGIAVGEISETLDKGRHTTRVAELHPLSFGGWVADTPGIRELASIAIDKADLGWCFRDLRPFIHDCRFQDCSHTNEPSCAVRDAAGRGDIDPDRYDSYLRILRGEER